MKYEQYQIILVNLDPAIGSEIKKTRPCVIVSPNEMNKHIRTIIIAPLTSTSNNYPTRVKISYNDKTSWIVVDQIRTIDKRRVIKTLGELSKSEIKTLKSVIKETLVD